MGIDRSVEGYTFSEANMEPQTEPTKTKEGLGFHASLREGKPSGDQGVQGAKAEPSSYSKVGTITMGPNSRPYVAGRLYT